MTIPHHEHSSDSMKTIFLCEDTPDGIFAAVYDAGVLTTVCLPGTDPFPPITKNHLK